MTSLMQRLIDSDALAIDTEVVTDLLVGFVHDEVTKVGFDRVVVGLSGGVDSALTAAIAVRALGGDRVIPVLMPYRSSSPASEGDARRVCEALGMSPVLSDISPQIDAYFEARPDADRSRRGNKMARERMTILYDLSFAENALVVGTSNKTELLLGYGTVFGDMASALNPIGDLYKSQVWALATAMGLPKEVVSKVPSADLWEGQSDEAELGFGYAEVDSLLFRLVDERCTVAELMELGYAEDFITQVTRRIQGSQYKRRLPVIAKLSARTIDREFRYPRDWGH